MKIKNIKEVEEFIKAVDSCQGNVFRELICNDLLSSVFSGNHHKLMFNCF